MAATRTTEPAPSSAASGQRPALNPEARPGTGPETAGIHRHGEPIGAADGEDQEPDEDPGMPAGPEPTDPAGFAERDEILGQPGDRLEGRQRAVGEPLGDPGLLHERIDQSRRVSRQGKRDPQRGNRAHAAGEGHAGQPRRAR